MHFQIRVFFFFSIIVGLSFSGQAKVRDSLHVSVLKSHTERVATSPNEVQELDLMVAIDIINHKKGLGVMQLHGRFFSAEGIPVSPLYKMDPSLYLKKSSTWEKSKRDGFKVHRKLYNVVLNLKPSELLVTNDPGALTLKLYGGRYRDIDTNTVLTEYRLEIPLPERTLIGENPSHFKKTPSVLMNQWTLGPLANYGFDISSEIGWDNPHPYYAANQNGVDPNLIEIEVQLWDTSATLPYGKHTYIDSDKLWHGRSSANIGCHVPYEDFDFPYDQPLLIHLEARSAGSREPLFTYTTVQQPVSESDLGIIPLKKLQLKNTHLEIRDTLLEGAEPALKITGHISFDHGSSEINDPIPRDGLPLKLKIGSSKRSTIYATSINVKVDKTDQHFSSVVSKVKLYGTLILDSGHHEINVRGSITWPGELEHHILDTLPEQKVDFFMPAIYNYQIRASNVVFASSNYDVKGLLVGKKAGRGYPDPYMSISNSAGQVSRTSHTKNAMTISSASGSILSASSKPCIRLAFYDRDKGIFNGDDVIGSQTVFLEEGKTLTGMRFGNVNSCDFTVESKRAVNCRPKLP